MPFIPYGRQSISESDIRAVVEVLRSDFLTQGPTVPAFEKAVLDLCGADFGVATNSATSALHIACLALGVGPGDRVWTSPITFVATANCARYCGADVDFVDIDPVTFNMSPDRLAEKLARAAREKTLPRVIIPVHFAGQSCELAAIHELAKSYGVRVIEDASHAIGGRYRNGPIGDCRYSDITIFSFHPVKIITTAEGGMAVTNDEALADRMRLLRSHGITRNAAEMTHAPDGAWYYQQIDLGFNYRLTDLQAALGISQISNIHDWIARRNAIAARYNEKFEHLKLVTPTVMDTVYSAWHLYVVQLRDDAPLKRGALFDLLRSDGLGINVHYIPVHLQPYYQNLGFKKGDFPASETYYEKTITLPIFASLTNEQQDFVIDRVSNYCA